jgi:hypothetical protein
MTQPSESNMPEPQIRHLKRINGGPPVDITAQLEYERREREQRLAEKKRRRKQVKAARKARKANR